MQLESETANRRENPSLLSAKLTHSIFRLAAEAAMECFVRSRFVARATNDQNKKRKKMLTHDDCA